MTIKDYSSTAASNTAINGVSIAGTAPVSNMDDGLRNVMADISNWTDSDTLASGSTTDLGSVPGMYVTVSGTATITSFGTLKAGMVKFVYFSGAGQITHNATSMILPGAANIARAAGDTAVFVSEGSGNWRCAAYQYAAGSVFTGAGPNIILRSNNTGAGIAYIRFQDTVQTPLGYIGLDSASTSNLAIKRNTAGNIDIDATSGGTVTVTGFASFAQSASFGTYSGSGATAGKDIQLSTIANLRSSTTLTTSATHQQFINGNGPVGSITTSGTSTTFATTSDERLKDFIGEYDPVKAIEIIRADPVRDFYWKTSGEYAVGWGAQSSFAISPDLATEGEGEPGDDGFIPWGIDQGKRTPYLWAALTWALDKIDDLEWRLSALEARNDS